MLNDLKLEKILLTELNLPTSIINYTKKEIQSTKTVLKRFKTYPPIVIDLEKNIILGEQVYIAAKELGWEMIDTVSIENLKPAEVKAFRIAFLRINKFGEFDLEKLRLEILDITNEESLNIGFEELAYDAIELDSLYYVESNKLVEKDNSDASSSLVLDNIKRIVKPGDLIQLGKHLVLCANSLIQESFIKLLLNNEKAALSLTDSPYNLKLKNNVTKQKQHKEFEFASGEMTDAEFQEFLSTIFTRLKENSIDGSLHYLFMDWKHSYLLQKAADGIYSKLLNICIWDKTKAGMGSFYRSQHEFCFVYQSGKGKHINNIQLGANGRNRSNIWQYEGMNISTKQANKLRQLHPTVKPVPMLVDIMLDASLPGDIVLDCFGGSGSTLIAAEQCGRKARLIEIDPHYCDVIIHRWGELTGKKHKILNREVH